jgi:aspartyl-tRNA(Asn)/glutamyl-tRNA(Gln) amidotransferase subunit C
LRPVTPIPGPTDWSAFCANRSILEVMTMSLTLSDVKRIAALARLEFSDTESEAALRSLTDIFGLIGQMQAVDTEDIEPMSHGFDPAVAAHQRLRADIATHTDSRAAFQQGAPATERGLYLVPKVIE